MTPEPTVGRPRLAAGTATALVRASLGDAGRRKIASNIAWLAGERAIRMVVSFVMLAWTARHLGVEQFGALNYAIAFVGLLSPLANLAADQIIVRDLVDRPKEAPTTLGTSFVVKTVMDLVIVALTIGTVLLFPRDGGPIDGLIVVVSFSYVFGGFSVVELWFQSQVEGRRIVLARNLSFLLSTAIRIVLLRTGAPVMAFAWVMAVEAALGAIACLHVYRGAGNRVSAWRFRTDAARALARISAPLILSSFAVMVYMRIDQIMLGQMVGDDAVGIYSVAVRLSEVWPFVSTIIVKSFAPSIIESRRIGEAAYYRKIQRLCTMQAITVYCIAIPMTFLARPFVVLLFGRSYAAAGVVLSVHIWSSMFLFLGYVKEVWIAAEGVTWFSFWFTLAGAVSNVLLNLVLIPRYEEVGAALATLVSYALADYVMCFFYRPARRFGWIMTRAMTLGLVRYGTVAPTSGAHGADAASDQPSPNSTPTVQGSDRPSSR